MDLEKILRDRHNYAEWYIFHDILVHETEEAADDARELRDFNTLSPWLPAFVDGPELLWEPEPGSVVEEEEAEDVSSSQEDDDASSQSTDPHGA